MHWLLRPFLVLAVLSWSGAACKAQSSSFQLEPAFPGLSFERPVDLQHAGDGSGRLFVVEQEGVVRVVDRPGEGAQARVFLDLRDRVLFGGEQGLLGLAFHPDYRTNGLFFVNYTARNPRRSVISRFRVDASDPNRADRTSETVLLEVEQPYSNHNGGQVRFGPDGYLYIGLGDGGSGGDPQDHGENPRTLLGAILRIDVNGTDGGRAYAIPPDNPFVGNDRGYREEIYAYGLRNPWRFSFDPPTGTLWAADVGQNAYEEIDLIEKGGNYGWDVMEGNHCFEPRDGCDREGLALPIWEYPRGEGQSITGGYVYRGARVPDLVGRYIYADYVSGRIWALAFEGRQATDNRELLDTSLNISAFGVDEDRELYLCAFDGRIYRFAAGSSTGVVEQPGELGVVEPNYPNPFGTATRIAFRLPAPGPATLAVYDVAGRMVRRLVDRALTAGLHEVEWDGRDERGRPLPSGVYLYRLAAADYQSTSRMVLVR